MYYFLSSHTWIYFILYRAESVRWLLDTLNVCATHPVIQSELCTTVELPDGMSSPAVRYVIICISLTQYSTEMMYRVFYFCLWERKFGIFVQDTALLF